MSQTNVDIKKPEPKPVPTKEQIEAAKAAKDKIVKNNQIVRK